MSNDSRGRLVGIPRVVYKYFDLNGLKCTLESSRFLVRPVDQYNDPFECVPQMDEEGIRQMYLGAFNNPKHLQWLSTQVHLIGRELTPAQLRLLLRNDQMEAKRIIGAVRAQNQATPLEWAGSFQAFMAEVFGFVCFSKVGDEQLMWSHYAKDHTGFVLGFELGPNNEAVEVQYQPERVPYRTDTPELREEFLRRIFSTKAPEWQYEQEIRLRCVEQTWETESDGRRRGYLAFDRSQVTGVWAGLRTTADDLQKIQQVLRSVGYTPSTIGRVTMDEREYRLHLS